MSIYIMLFNYTDQGLRNIKKSPGRLDAARKAAEPQLFMTATGFERDER